MPRLSILAVGFARAGHVAPGSLGACCQAAALSWLCASCSLCNASRCCCVSDCGCLVCSEGVLVTKKDTMGAFESIPEVSNLHVLMLLKSLKSREFITVTFNWCVPLGLWHATTRCTVTYRFLDVQAILLRLPDRGGHQLLARVPRSPRHCGPPDQDPARYPAAPLRRPWYVWLGCCPHALLVVAVVSAIAPWRSGCVLLVCNTSLWRGYCCMCCGCV